MTLQRLKRRPSVRPVALIVGMGIRHWNIRSKAFLVDLDASTVLRQVVAFARG